MSTSVDNRIVSMEFDNHKFQQNAEATMKTLDQLEASLQFKDAGKGLDDVTKKAKGVDFAPLSKSLDEVSGKFSALEIAGIAAIANITNKIVDAGLRIAKSLSIDQITAGFSKYEEKMTAIQSIMNSTGESLEDVQAVISKLAQYSDDTSYNLSTMVDAMSKFTSYGVDIQDAGKYIMAVGNIAGFSGASVQQASHAFEGFAKTLGQGHLSMQVWKTWFGTARVNGVKIKETFIDAAVAAGTLKRGIDGIARTAKGTEVTVEAFEETLKQGWADTELVTKAVLDRWGSYTEMVQGMADAWGDANGETKNSYELLMDLEDGIEGNVPALKAFQTWMRNAKGETVSFDNAASRFGEMVDELSKKGYESATVYRTFTDAIEAAKDAVSTSWSIIIENITGDAIEAQDLWSTVGEILLEIFNGPLEKIKMATDIFHKHGSVQKIIDLVETLYNKVSIVADAFKGAFRNVFPEKNFIEIAQAMDKVVLGITNFLDVMTLSENEAAGLKAVLTTLMSPLKIVVNLVKTLATFGLKVVLAVRYIVGTMLEAYLALTNIERVLGKSALKDNKLYKILVGVRNGITIVKNAFVGLVGIILSFIDSIDLIGTIDFVAGSLWNLGSGIINVVSKAFETLKSIIDSIDLSGVLKLLTYVGSGLKSSFLTWTGFIGAVFDDIKASFSKVTDAFKALVKTITVVDLSGIETAWENLVNVFKNPITEGSALDNWFKKGQETLNKIWNLIRTLALSVYDIVKTLGIANIAFAGVGIAIISLIGNTKKVVGNFAKLLKAMTFGQETKSTLNLVGVFLSLAAAIAVLAGSLYILGTQVEVGRLWNVVGAISAIALVLGGLSAGLALLAKKLDIESQMFSFAAMMISFGAAALMMSEAFKNIEGMAWGDIAKACVAIGASATIIVVAMRYISKNIAASISSALGLLFFSQILNRTINVLASDAAMAKWEKLLKTFLDLVTRVRDWLLDATSAADFIKNKGLYVIGGIAAFAGALAMLKFAKGIGAEFKNLAIGLTAMNASLYLMTFVISKISSFSKAELKKAIPTIALLSAIITGLMFVLSKFTTSKSSSGEASGGLLGKFGLNGSSTSQKFNGIAAAAALAGVVLSMGIMVNLVKKVNEIKTADVWKDIAIVGALSVLITGMMAALNLTARGTNVKGQYASMVILTECFLVLNKLSKMTDEEILKTVLGLLGVAAAIGVVLAAFAAVEAFAKDSKSQLITIAVIFGELIAGIILVTKLCKDPEALEATWKAMSAVAVAMGVFAVGLGVSMKLMADKVGTWPTMFKKLIILISGIAVLVGALIALSKFGSFENIAAYWRELGAIMVAIGFFGIEYATAYAMLSNTVRKGSDAWAKKLLVLITGIAALCAAIWAITSFADLSVLKDSWLQLGGVMIAIGVFCDLFSLAMVGMSKVDPSAAGAMLLGMGGMLLGLAFMLNVLTKDDIDKLHDSALQLSVVIVAFGGMCTVAAWGIKILSAVPLSAGINAVGLLATFLIAMAAVGTLLIELSANLDPARIEKGMDVLAKIGTGIGEFVGNMIGGFIGGALSFIPMLGQHLTDFSTNIKGFLNMVSTIDANQVAGVTKLVQMIRELSELEKYFKNTIEPITAFAKVGEAFDSFGTIVISFFDKFSGFGADRLTSMTNLTNALAEFNNSLPYIKESFGTIGNVNQMERFGAGIEAYAKAMVLFSNNVKQIDSGVVESAANAGKALGEMCKYIPSEGGIWQSIVGTKNLSGFAQGMTLFAGGIVAFKIATVGFEYTDSMKQALEAGKEIAEMSESIPNAGGKIAEFLGDNTLGIWSNDLPSFGQGIAIFANNLVKYGFASGQSMVDQAASAGEVIAEMSKSIPNAGGELAKFFGDNTLGVWSQQLPEFGKGIAQFSNNLLKYGFSAGLEWVEPATAAAVQVAKMTQDISKSGGIVQDIFGEQDLNAFGEDLANLGSALSRYSENLQGYKSKDVDVATSAARRFVDMAIMLDQNIYTSMGYFIEDLPTLGEALASFHSAISDVSIDDVNADCEILDRIVQTAKGTEGLTAEQANNFDEWLENIAGSSLIAFSNTFKNADALLKETSDTFAKKVEENFSRAELIEKYTSIGKWVVRGLSMGLNNTEERDGVMRAARSLAQLVEKTIRDETTVNSPPPKYETIGEWITAGMAMGLENREQCLAMVKAGKVVIEKLDEGIQEEIDASDLSTVVGLYVEDNMLKGLQTSLKTVIVNGKVYVKNAVGQIVGFAQNTFGNLLGTDEANDPYGGLKEFEKKLEEAFNPDIDLGDVGGSGGAAKKVVKTIEQLTEEYKLCANSVQGLYDSHKETFDLIGGVTGKSGWDIAYDRVWRYGEALWEATTTTDELAKVTAGDADAIEAKFKGISEAINKIYTEAASKFSKLSDIIFEFNEEDGPGGTDAWGIINNADEAYAKSKKYVANMEKLYEKIVDLKLDPEFFKQMYDAGPDSDSLLESYIGMSDEDLIKLNETLQRQLGAESELGTKLANMMVSLGYEVDQGVADGMTAGAIRLVQAGEASMDQVKAALQTAVADEKITGYGSDLIEAFIKGIEDNTYKLTVQTSETMQDGVDTPVSKTMNKERGIYHGVQLMAGIIEGIKSMQDEVSNAVSSVMASVDQNYIDDPNVREGSPSKHWKEHGRFLMLGLAEGVLANKGVVINALGEVNSFIDTATVEAFNAAINLLDTSGLNNPVITPTLDLSEVKKGVRGMSSMFEDSKIAASGIQNSSQNGNNNSGVTQVFNQNNYSPKALDRLTIYRQSRNQFAQMKEALGQL